MDDWPLQREMLTQASEKRLLEQAKACAFEYLDSLAMARAFPGEDALRGLDAFDEPLPTGPAPGDEVVRTLHAHGSPAAASSAGGRYFGFVNGGALPAALAARWLADAWDQNAALWLTSPVAATLEAVCERWLVELFGLPAGTAAGFVTGTSTATLCGLATGRNELLRRLGWDADADGLFGAPRLRVVAGAQAHATVGKALGVLGLGKAAVEAVPVDAQGRMDPARMPALDDRCLVVAQAGNVNSGAFDPLDEIVARARRAGAWLHVDGAFGLWAAGCESRRHLVRGVEGADSWSADAHKTLNAPYDCGVVLVRDRAALAAALQTSASYILASGHRDGMHLTLDMSRRARAVELWAALKALGRSGVDELVSRLCAHARSIAEGLSRAGFRVLNDVVFNQVLVACGSADATRATLERLQRAGECWCGGAQWNGEPVIRVSVCSWATTGDDVARTIAAFAAARRAAGAG